MADPFYRGTGSNAGRPATPAHPLHGHPNFGPGQGINFDDHSTGQPTLKAQVPGTLSLDAIRARLDLTFSPNSQRHNEAVIAVEGLKVALENLAAHGMPLAVIDAPPPVVQEYPMALQHSVHGHRVVANKREEDEARKSGWRRHPSLEAKRAGPKGPGSRGIFTDYYAATRPQDGRPGIFAAYHKASREAARPSDPRARQIFGGDGRARAI
jgi:hypothetical protein